jgi:hypothetical protein
MGVSSWGVAMAKERGEVELSGVVVDILPFRNSDDGIGLLRIKVGAATEQVIGVVTEVAIGDFVKAVGTEHVHPRHGKQLRSKLLTVALPEDEPTTIEWLARHFQIPRSTAKEILEEWYALPELPECTPTSKGEAHEELFRALRDNDPFVRDHFSRHVAHHQYGALQDYVARKMAIDELLVFGLNTKEAHALYRARGKEAVVELKADPYAAYYYIEGMPFTKVDRIYLSQGRNAPNDERRLRALCLYELRDRADEGHTCMYYDDFLDFMSEKYSDVSAQRFVARLNDLMPEFITLYGSPPMVQLVQHARYEAGIAEFVLHGRVPQ